MKVSEILLCKRWSIKFSNLKIRSKKIFSLILILTPIFIFAQKGDKIIIENLECEYLENPIGIDTPHPRFTWQIKTSGQDVMQKGVEIVLGTDANDVSLGKGNVWESGNLNLTSIPVVYAGPELAPFTTYFWSVKIADEDGLWSPFSVEVKSDQPIYLEKENLTACFMHSDVPEVGHIHSSNPTLNKLWAASNASYLSNLFGYPTDCPHREKLGWTGDAMMGIETGLYNFDAITVYEK